MQCFLRRAVGRGMEQGKQSEYKEGASKEGQSILEPRFSTMSTGGLRCDEGQKSK